MPLLENLRDMERGREAYWLRNKHTSDLKLRWRAIAVRHCFHLLPGETVLELGAGSGLWTQHLDSVFGGLNPITAAIFNEDFAQSAFHGPLADHIRFLQVNDFDSGLPEEQFDYVVGTGILCHDQYSQNLALVRRLLKPGGEFLFFEANHWNPQVWLKEKIPALGLRSGNPRCQVGLRKYKLMQMASHAGFTHLEIVPYDLLHPRTPRALIPLVQSIAYIFEHAPVIREFCGTLYIWGRKPGDDLARRRPRANLAHHQTLFASTSVVVPCHNEEMNVSKLVDNLLALYGEYIHEILIVNDSSTDRTADVTREISQTQPRVKLVNRQPPNGVGRALRDGYAAATGKYILSMDSDFVQILPEFRDLFDAIAEGYDGAIGSRFSYESMLINYPFMKIIANRGFHLALNLFSSLKVRDLSNNLKLYRSEIFKSIQIEQTGFAANAETGLKPLLRGYRIKEVPISWINRTPEMGTSSFRTLKVAPQYLSALGRVLWRGWSHRRHESPSSSTLYVQSSAKDQGYPRGSQQ